jgi:hypothetical protein
MHTYWVMLDNGMILHFSADDFGHAEEQVADHLKSTNEDSKIILIYVIPTIRVEEDICDECGNEYPARATGMAGDFHESRCSLYVRET